MMTPSHIETMDEEITDPEATPYSSQKVTKDSSKKSLAKIAAMGLFMLMILSLVIGVGSVLWMSSQKLSVMKINGSSMEPEFSNGDWVLFKGDTTERAGNIVFFNKPNQWDQYIDQDTFLVKRIVGLPNDVISVKDGGVYVSGEKIHDVGKNSGYVCNAPEGYQHKLTTREIFVVGDNYKDSLDSLRILCDGNADAAYVSPDDVITQGSVQNKLKGAFFG